MREKGPKYLEDPNIKEMRRNEFLFMYRMWFDKSEHRNID
jgi:hypothetical protein